MLFVFWPAEQVKQIRQTLAHINITEKYREGGKSGNSLERQPEETLQKPKVWRERSSGELKTYLSQRGVDMMEVDSERYLREIMGDPDFSVKPLNSLLQSTTIDLQRNSIKLTMSEMVPKLTSSKLGNTTSEPSIESSHNAIDSTSTTSKVTESIGSQNFHSNQSSQLISESAVTSVFSTISKSLPDLTISENSLIISTDMQQSSIDLTKVVTVSLDRSDNSGKSLFVTSSTRMNNSSVTNVVSSTPVELPVEKLDDKKNLSKNTNEVVIRSKLSKIYELNALIYNPLNLPSPEPILVELLQGSELVIYVPINLIENTNGTYLSQDHIELWLDRSDVKPQSGYGNISHQYGIGLNDRLWVVDFLQNESVYDLKVNLSKKGKLLEVKIVNLPADLRAWNVVFSKAVKEGKNWVQGQLLSAVEDFTWGDSDKLIPVKFKATNNAPE